MATSQPKSPPPKIFIGSTTEALDVAGLIKSALFQKADVTLWSDPGVFGVGKVTIESIEERLSDFPFGIFVMSPDDVVISRKRKSLAPRDNLIFELGLWFGRYGRHSAFMVVPYGQKVRLPSDLQAVTVAEYKVRDDAEPAAYDVTDACRQIMEAINQVQKKKTASLKSPDT